MRPIQSRTLKKVISYVRSRAVLYKSRPYLLTLIIPRTVFNHDTQMRYAILRTTVTIYLMPSNHFYFRDWIMKPSFLGRWGVGGVVYTYLY